MCLIRKFLRDCSPLAMCQIPRLYLHFNFTLQNHYRLNLPGMSGALPPPPPRDTSGFERKLRSQSMETLLQSFDNKSSLDHHGVFLSSSACDCSASCNLGPISFFFCGTTDSFHTHSYSTEMSEPGFWKRQRLPSLDSTVCVCADLCAVA